MTFGEWIIHLVTAFVPDLVLREYRPREASGSKQRAGLYDALVTKLKNTLNQEDNQTIYALEVLLSISKQTSKAEKLNGNDIDRVLEQNNSLTPDEKKQLMHILTSVLELSGSSEEQKSQLFQTYLRYVSSSLKRGQNIRDINQRLCLIGKTEQFKLTEIIKAMFSTVKKWRMNPLDVTITSLNDIQQDLVLWNVQQRIKHSLMHKKFRVQAILKKEERRNQRWWNLKYPFSLAFVALIFGIVMCALVLFSPLLFNK